jgi:ubiquinone/menaquinone biosynthesis C-methylase UbiE
MTPPDEKRSVRDFWDERARDDNAEANQVTHPDVWQRWIEIELLKRQLRPDDDVLEVGCGNGYTTAHVAPLVRSVRAVDFSEAMIERAKSDCQDVRTASGGVPQFSVGDALRLSADDLGQFDLVTSQRCLINLPSWEDQQEALRRIASVTKPGGRFIMMEGCAQGRRALDEARERMGLDRMPNVWHNIDFEVDQTKEFLATDFELVHEQYLGTYDFVSRLVHPLLVAPEGPQYEAEINRIAAELTMQLTGFPELGRLFFWVLERRSD